MKLTEEVKSSNISKIGYEDDDLFVQYLTGSVYRYKKVPTKVYEDLKAAESKGRFINAEIKGKYEYEKVDKT